MFNLFRDFFIHALSMFIPRSLSIYVVKFNTWGDNPNTIQKYPLPMCKVKHKKYFAIVVFSAVASKSSGGIVGKWGSFSSVRPAYSASDLKRASSSSNDVSVGAPKPKKFFKSRDVTTPAADDDDEVSFKDAVVSKVISK